jgi:hypothetical protein
LQSHVDGLIEAQRKHAGYRGLFHKAALVRVAVHLRRRRLH